MTPELEAALGWAESFREYGGKLCYAEILASALRESMVEIEKLKAERNDEIRRTDILDDAIEIKDREIAALKEGIKVLEERVIFEDSYTTTKAEIDLALATEVIQAGNHAEVLHEGPLHDDTTSEVCRACLFNEALTRWNARNK